MRIIFRKRATHSRWLIVGETEAAIALPRPIPLQFAASKNANPCRPETDRDQQQGSRTAVEPDRWLAMELHRD